MLHTIVAASMCTECGNLLCESGEQCVDSTCVGAGQCRVDCPLPVRSCVSSADNSGVARVCGGCGTCLGSTGTCECYSGYVGETCYGCSKGYVRVSGACVFMPGALVSCTDGVRNGTWP